ncbi:MAG: ferredoxin--nitrite reductase [Sulfurimonas sp.]|uniref:ferredoxin--nitrite reductase n=1 Tax=Sulfurimonas sp. TaxID=2022749 RepID=UPI002621EDED|nr:ferredoxin--nitrite reductase [Sulfurimonas sp.]MDD5401502.1 ferredoxin--nitrite reductase [Sulfurimonas sp.]
MVELQKAYEARAKKLNKVEETKVMQTPKEAFEKLEYYAKNGYDSIAEIDKDYFLKCFGIYDKDSTTAKKFMLRVRISGGHLNALQARVLGEIAKEFGQDYMDITTRAQVELRYLDIKDMPTIFERMQSVGITSYQTGVDNFRNIVNDPLDSYGFDNILPSQELLERLQSKFLYNYEWISALPRKFNTAITGSISNRCNAFGHDCSFVLAQKNGVYGYNMYLGGKVGKIAKSADIFLLPSEVESAYGSIIDIFKRFGFRDNRNKNRLSFLVEAVGMEEIAKAIRQNAGVNFATAGEAMTKLDFNDSDHGKVELRDGSFALHIVIPSGIFSGSDLIEVSELSQKYGNSQVRFDVEQSLYIMGVREVEALLKESLFQRYKSVDSVYKNHLIACAGSQHCPFGVIENKSDAIKMAEYLEKKVPMLDGRVRMYWSGCVKGCGLHGVADIGFEGCKVKIGGEMEGAVNISLGGKLTSEGVEGYTVIKSAPLRYAHFYVETLMLEYKRLKNHFESFEQFNERVLKLCTPASIGFMMKLGAYLREKNIDIEIGFSEKVNTGKNEEFELFEIGRKLYYKLSNQEPYSAYERFTNALKNEKLQNIRSLVPNIDENLALMCERILDTKEQNRAVVFSEVAEFIALF